MIVIAFSEETEVAAFPSLRASRGGLDRTIMASAANYLSGGMYLWATGGTTSDVFSGATIVKGGIQTDGEYVWSATLTHYVRTYGIAIPTEFISRMESNAWRCPPVSESRAQELSSQLEAWSKVEILAHRHST
jgi:hypothetical protein